MLKKTWNASGFKKDNGDKITSPDKALWMIEQDLSHAAVRVVLAVTVHQRKGIIIGNVWLSENKVVKKILPERILNHAPNGAMLIGEIIRLVQSGLFDPNDQHFKYAIVDLMGAASEYQKS